MLGKRMSRKWFSVHVECKFDSPADKFLWIFKNLPPKAREKLKMYELLLEKSIPTKLLDVKCKFEHPIANIFLKVWKVQDYDKIMIFQEKSSFKILLWKCKRGFWQLSWNFLTTGAKFSIDSHFFSIVPSKDSSGHKKNNFGKFSEKWSIKIWQKETKFWFFSSKKFFLTILLWTLRMQDWQPFQKLSPKLQRFSSQIKLISFLWVCWKKYFKVA